MVQRIALATEILGLPTGYYDDYIARVGAVTPEDVLAVSQQELRPEDMIILVVGDVSEFDAPLGPVWRGCAYRARVNRIKRQGVRSINHLTPYHVALVSTLKATEFLHKFWGRGEPPLWKTPNYFLATLELLIR